MFLLRVLCLAVKGVQTYMYNLNMTPFKSLQPLLKLVILTPYKRTTIFRNYIFMKKKLGHPNTRYTFNSYNKSIDLLHIVNKLFFCYENRSYFIFQQPLSATNFLYELDRVTQDTVSVSMLCHGVE